MEVIRQMLGHSISAAESSAILSPDPVRSFFFHCTHTWHNSHTYRGGSETLTVVEVQNTSLWTRDPSWNPGFPEKTSFWAVSWICLGLDVFFPWKSDLECFLSWKSGLAPT